jgi:hypothetical protein
MTISAKMIAGSVSPEGIKLTTMQLRYPRFIHAELMTHRVFSRNASSSRAIPVERLIQDIINDTAMPIHWGKNQKGMQADEECATTIDLSDTLWGDQYGYAKNHTAWLLARDQAIDMARAFSEAGYHKQIVNRLLEPFSHINVLVTSTEWKNWFGLRAHPDAQPEIQELARCMAIAMATGIWQPLAPGEWHLPYVDFYNVIGGSEDLSQMDQYAIEHELDLIDVARRVSVARCARVSYLTHDGAKPSIKADLALYDQLVGSHPIHASPAEHQATPDTQHIVVDASEGPSARKAVKKWDNWHLHGNFKGWIQHRKTLPNENLENVA